MKRNNTKRKIAGSAILAISFAVLLLGVALADRGGLELKPIKIKVIDLKIPFTMWGLGGVLMVFGMMNILKQRRKNKILNKKLEEWKAPLDLLDRLQEKILLDDDLRTIGHHLHQIMMAVLIQKEGTDTLSGQLDKIPEAIKEKITALRERCQRFYSPELPQKKDLDIVIKEIRDLFEFYIQKELEEVMKNHKKEG